MFKFLVVAVTPSFFSVRGGLRLVAQLSVQADRGRGLPSGVRNDRDALLASGVGIASINERVRELGGELTIRSTDQGTTLGVTLPAATPH